jgi:peptidoglycan/LPS O-acetylase OafA/YrhL
MTAPSASPAGSATRGTPIVSLTGVRGIAALWVVMCHFRTELALALPGLPAGDLLEAVAFHGYLGVDLFAFLSGFVISYTYGDRLASFGGAQTRRFLWLRLARVYPMHLFMLVVFVVARVLGEGTSALTSAAGDATFWRQALLIHGWGFDETFAWNVPSWTVSSEWFCYLLFPLFAPALQRVRSGPLAAGLAVLVLATTTALLFAVGHPRFTAYLDWGLLRIGGEFLTGCLLYRAWKADFGRDRYWGWTALFALVFSVFASTLHPALAVPGFAVVVYALAWQESPAHRVFGNRVVVYLGEISYSVYLVHWFVLQYVEPLGLSALPDSVRVWAMFAVVIAASAAAHHAIENPARRWLREAGA